jgi:hypothetical protein
VETHVTSDQALYLYGIVADAAPLPTECAAVEDGTRIDVIAASGIACVVSAVTIRDYQSPLTGRNAAEQLAWVTPRALRHHDVVRRLHAATTVIPLKFGTLSSRVADVRAMLAEHAEPIGALLREFDGKDEWSLTIRVDTSRVTDTLAHNDSTLIALGADEHLLTDGRAYFQRKKRQQRLADLLAAHVADTTASVYARVAEYVDAFAHENTAASGAALLVDRSRFDGLSICLATLEGEQSASGLTLELRGPWAPYSFVNGRADCWELTPASGIDSRARSH